MVNFSEGVGHLLFSLFSLRDVESDAHHAGGLAILEINPALGRYPMQGAVRPNCSHLNVIVFALADRLRHRGVDPPAIIRMKRAQKYPVAHRDIEGYSEENIAAVRPG